MDIAKLVLDYIETLIWPSLTFAIVLRFRGQIGELISRTRTVDTVAGSVEFAEARELIVEAQQRATTGGEQKVATPAPSAAASSLARRLQATSHELQGGRILWVDDYPNNNTLLIRLFRSIGMTVDTSLTTEEALTKLGSQTFDILLTDMGRGDDGNAGNKLLQQLSRRSYDIPAVVYSSPGGIQRGVDPRVFAATDSPDELVHYVIDLMSRAAYR